MSDFATSVQNAFFTALNVASVTSLATVLQHVPEDTQPPLVILSQITLEPFGGKAGGLDKAIVEIVCLFRGPKRAGLYAIQAAVRAVIDQQPISAAGVTLSVPFHISTDSDQLEDGVTYLGTQRFEVFVQ